MRNEYDANRALAAHRLGRSERCLRPRPLLQRMAERERAARNARRMTAAALVTIACALLGALGAIAWGLLA